MAIENGILASKKVALVTGGSRGIGKDIALSLAKMGIGIVLTYQSNQMEGDRVAEDIQAFGGAAVGAAIERRHHIVVRYFPRSTESLLAEKFGTEKIDFLINNGGFGKGIPIDSLTESEFDSFVDVHFKGVVFLTQKALRMMNDGGGIVFVTRRRRSL